MIVLGLIAATVAALIVGHGSPAVALAPALALVGVVAVARIPPRVLAFTLVGLVLTVESPQDRPAYGLWQSPLHPLGKLLFDKVGEWLPLPVPLSIFELLVLALAVGLLLRRQDAKPGTARGSGLGVRGAIALSSVALLAWFGFGLATGGSFQAAFWQARQLLFLAPLAFIFHETLTGGRRELVRLGQLVVGAALFKALLGAWFYYRIGRPSGRFFEYVTIHADSVLFTGALILLALWALHQPSRRTLLALVGLGGVIFWGLFLNDRRIAWAELLGGMAVAVAAMPRGAVKRRALKLAVLLLPLLAVYTAVGWGSSSRFFRPLHAFSTMEEDQNSSTFARKAENFNVARTVATSPLVGHGFGHPYDEIYVNKIGHSFDLYRYIPHNCIYRLYMNAGPIGFVLIWFVLPFAVLLAARASRKSDDPVVRIAMLECVALVLVFGFQSWGDMGTQSYPPVVLMALVVGVSARVALRVAAWPAARAAARDVKVAVGEAGCSWRG